MNPRQIIRQAFNFKESDKIPLDFGGHRSSSIAVQAYKRLREYLGLEPSELYMYDVVQQLAVIEDDVLDVIGSDVVMLGPNLYKEPEFWKEWRLHDGTEVKIPKTIDIRTNDDGDYYVLSPKGVQSCIQKKDCLYFEQIMFPYHGSDDEEFPTLEEQMNEIMWWHIPCPPDSLTIEEKGKLARKLRAETDRAVYGIFGGGHFEPGQQAFRMDNFLMELAANPDRCVKFLDKLTEFHMKNLEKYLDHVGPYLDIIGFGDDLGMQTGSQISPRMFDEMLKPRYKRMWSMVKEKMPHLKICLHSCGSIHNLLPSLIDAGMDSFNPVQISCRNMEPERLKKDFGDKVVFWGGGCDTSSMLSRGTPEQISEHVKYNVDIFSRNGGFVFQQVHNILADVPPENIMAMFNALQ
ncbi:MAG: uroporphyrinogen decarboxylase family protein [Clostridia bacterium]|nr:uroporphyrinogen decarboxylase family protein [Clostridia bacterium]